MVRRGFVLFQFVSHLVCQRCGSEDGSGRLPLAHASSRSDCFGVIPAMNCEWIGGGRVLALLLSPVSKLTGNADAGHQLIL